ncbi:MAG: Dyp-type peroxidase [Oceanospirillaceae bacterium]|nr:Dyp-type peroxidase [Oceanospirillaceae bacterium]
MDDEYQQGIIGAPSKHALFITLNRDQLLNSRQKQTLLRHIAKLPSLLQEQQQVYPDAQLYLNIGLSSGLWDYLEIQPKPAGLRPFKAITNKKVTMPASDADLLLHLRSNRHDVNYHLSQILLSTLFPILKIDEMVHGFSYLDSRDLTGFVDGTENPEGEHRREVALINKDKHFAGGSYVHIQKYQHNLARWQQLSVEQQECSYGRSKAANIEFSSSNKSSSAHTARSAIKNNQQQSVEILRQSLPFADQHSQGLMFASYAAQADSFDLILASMCALDKHGDSDAILNVSKAVSGHAFFTPSASWFSALMESS